MRGEMSFEELRLQSLDILSEAAANYGLPPDDEHYVAGSNSVAKELSANDLSNGLKHIRGLHDRLLTSNQLDEALSSRAKLDRFNEWKRSFEECEKVVGELQSGYEHVVSRTSSLHEACERSLAQQTVLAAGAERLHSNLHYFKQADAVMKKLTNSGSSLSVTGQSFAALLSTIHDCSKFLKQHSHYKDAALYSAKFSACLSRAMTVVRVTVCAQIEAAVSDVCQRQAALSVEHAQAGTSVARREQALSDEDTFALLYGLFASRSTAVRAALNVPEQLFRGTAELQELLSECETAYFAARRTLLQPIVDSTLRSLISQLSSSSCALTRQGCSLLLRLCDDEHRLYRQFFAPSVGGGAATGGATTPHPPRHGALSPTQSVVSLRTALSSNPELTQFDLFIEGMCSQLYDQLRAVVLRNPHLETLAEICMILKVEMIEERCYTAIDENIAMARASFARVMAQLVGDVAERIVYRTTMYAASDIAGYAPAPGDLAYPQKLLMIREIEKQTRAAAAAASTTTSAVDMHCLWYPTVRRTVVCLAKIFRCLDISVFQALSRELLAQCCASLETAAGAIEKGVGAAPDAALSTRRRLDAQLFLVKHVLILREQTSPYRQAAAAQRADYNASAMVSRDYQFQLGRVAQSAAQLWEDRDKWFALSNNALLPFLLNLPAAAIQVEDVSGDGRRQVDQLLRRHCTDLVETAARLIVGDIEMLIDRVEDAVLKPDFKLASHPDLAPDKMRPILGGLLQRLTSSWTEVSSAFSLYIGSKETETILLTPIKRRVIDLLARVHSFVAKAYQQTDRDSFNLPSVADLHRVLEGGISAAAFMTGSTAGQTAAAVAAVAAAETEVKVAAVLAAAPEPVLDGSNAQPANTNPTTTHPTVVNHFDVVRQPPTSPDVQEI